MICKPLTDLVKRAAAIQLMLISAVVLKVWFMDLLQSVSVGSVRCDKLPYIFTTPFPVYHILVHNCVVTV